MGHAIHHPLLLRHRLHRRLLLQTSPLLLRDRGKTRTLPFNTAPTTQQPAVLQRATEQADRGKIAVLFPADRAVQQQSRYLHGAAWRHRMHAG
ncbi:MAG: hypothetical protein A2940_02115 [Candidatus Wildermuthbacteria bacterium RIFCSPLOWO2_01_FULL_48_29]|uniref:Uncharacterized protein n=1 Tax=Candidatus Wildermuthbacteria bacterium RIFCSPLOWO2_01_FULL_48_29 TaxID=1802462 RepID=A0A1G2RMB0_9BACT|nr:MAG: hypothetical protein A2940_02115 [Candidatus Wildermuthbacteria bacterium RIFCSPLOWO2_01_FULL_48_29]